MKRFYQQELDDIRTNLVLIGEKVNEAARIAVDGLLENNLEKLKEVVNRDEAIDKLEADIDQASVRYITLRSPVSSDVRFILVAIKASHDLERAGDEAKKIALQSKKIINRDGNAGDTGAIEEMSKIACSMMKDAITSFLEEDLEMAMAVISQDKQVNKLNKGNFKRFSIGDKIDKTENATHYQKIFISKAIERIADHAKNLAEEVIYLLTGKMMVDHSELDLSEL